MAYTMRQAVLAKLAFNPLSAPDGQGEVFVGENQNRLIHEMVENKWDDPRFVTVQQIAKAGWSLVPGAKRTQIVVKEGGTWDNKVLFNASQVVGMPSLESMLEVAQARLVPEVDIKAAEQQLVEEQRQAAFHEEEGLLQTRRAKERSGAESGLVGSVVGQEEEDLMVGPAKRVKEQVDEVGITPVFREKGHGEDVPGKVGEPVIDHVARTLLGTVFKERVAGSGEFVREGEKKVAFLDRGGSLVVRDKQADTYQAVMELAKSKGWEAIELSGKPEHIARGWLEAQLLGIEVANYVPTEKDLAALDARRAEVAKTPEVQEKVAEKAGLAKDRPPEGAKIVTTGGPYIGPVVDIMGGYLVQKTGPDTFVSHKVSDFGATPPQVGDSLDLQYRDGRAMQRETRSQGKDVGGGREIGGR